MSSMVAVVVRAGTSDAEAQPTTSATTETSEAFTASLGSHRLFMPQS
jgi:hypothetical protein